jgi:ATPase subunit of ABC transporter with duplicated ATPase domains
MCEQNQRYFRGFYVSRRRCYQEGKSTLVEKTRLAMIKLLLEPVNVLILDEPSNHLDMKTKDIIKDALRDFDGTLILVSHDRDFLDGLATKVLNLEINEL